MEKVALRERLVAQFTDGSAESGGKGQQKKRMHGKTFLDVVMEIVKTS